MAAPLYESAPATGAAAFQPLAVVLGLLPLPILAALKYAYVRFRRGQSIHAPDRVTPKSVSSPVSSAPDPAPVPPPRPASAFWLALHPYLVGFLGSPDWEITISCRINKTLRRAKPPLTPSPLLAHSTVGRSTTSSRTHPSTAYSSTKSRATTRSSRSKYLSVCLVDKSRHRLPNDFAIMPLTDPTSPVQRPPLVHIPSASVRFSSQNSPTLMQIMEPVLSSWYDDSATKPPLVLLNDKSIISADSSQDKSASAADESSLQFYTPLGSPRTPGISASLSSPVMPFARLRKEHTISATSSMLTISAASASSPTSLSIAIFHSPIASSIPVPKPVYAPSLRPESCVVLPRDWQNDKENVRNLALLQSPTHRSPSLKGPTIYDCLPPRSDRSALGSIPFNVTKSAGKVKSSSTPVRTSSGSGRLTKPAVASPPLSSVRNSTASSMNAKSSPSASSLRSPHGYRDKHESWNLANLSGGDGKLDVDAVTRALGLGLGLGLPATSSASASASTSRSINATESESEVSALLTPIQDEDEDAAGRSPALCPGSCNRTFGWNSPDHSGGLDDMAGSSFLHGQPLCVIPEETRSEVGSIVGSVCPGLQVEASGKMAEADDSGVVSMELDSGIVESAILGRHQYEGILRSPASGASGTWDTSWREGESTRLSIGVAW